MKLLKEPQTAPQCKEIIKIKAKLIENNKKQEKIGKKSKLKS